MFPHFFVEQTVMFDGLIPDVVARLGPWEIACIERELLSIPLFKGTTMAGTIFVTFSRGSYHWALTYSCLTGNPGKKLAGSS